MKIFKILLLLFLFLNFESFSQDLISNKVRLAQSYLQAGKLEKAKQLYLSIIKTKPSSAYIESLNNIYLRLKEYDESKQLLISAIKNNPKEIRFYGLLGSTFHEINQIDSAYYYWEKALSVDSANKFNYKLISTFAQRNRAYDEAIHILQKGIETTGDRLSFTYDLANLYNLTSAYDKATEEYAELLLQSDKQFNLVLSRIRGILRTPSAYNEIIPVLSRYYDDSGKVVFLKLIAEVQKYLGKYEEALETSINIDKIEKNGVALFNFAKFSFDKREYEVSIKAFNMLFENYKNSPLIYSSKLQYAEALIKSRVEKTSSWKPINRSKKYAPEVFGKSIEILNELAANQSSDVSNRAKYLLGIVNYKYLKRLDEAGKFFNGIIEKFPFTKFASLSLKEMILISIIKGDLLKSEEYVAKLRQYKRAGDSIKDFAQFYKGRLDFWKGKFGFAKKTFSALSAKGKSVYSNDAIEYNYMITLFARDSLNLSNYATADLNIFREKYAKAKNILLSIKENKNVFLLDRFAKFRLAELLIIDNSYKEALALLNELIEDNVFKNFSDKSLFLSAKIYQFGLTDFDKAKEYYLRLLSEYPNSIYCNEARDYINKIDKTVNEKQH